VVFFFTVARVLLKKKESLADLNNRNTSRGIRLTNVPKIISRKAVGSYFTLDVSYVSGGGFFLILKETRFR
jgi:hypothetical protein